MLSASTVSTALGAPATFAGWLSDSFDLYNRWTTEEHSAVEVDFIVETPKVG